MRAIVNSCSLSAPIADFSLHLELPTCDEIDPITLERVSADDIFRHIETGQVVTEIAFAEPGAKEVKQSKVTVLRAGRKLCLE